MANGRIAQDALNRFSERRTAERIKKIDELRAVIKAMQTQGMPRARASATIVDMLIAVNGEGLEWGELGVKEDELPTLENTAVVMFLRRLIRRLRLEDDLSRGKVDAWCKMIVEEIAASNGSVTWDRLGTNGNELKMLADRATAGEGD